MNLDEITIHFRALSAMAPLHPISTEAEYDTAVAVLDELLDAGAANEQHPLSNLAATLGELIGNYDDMHYFPAEVNGAKMANATPLRRSAR